jgi:hypothetical protein
MAGIMHRFVAVITISVILFDYVMKVLPQNTAPGTVTNFVQRAIAMAAEPLSLGHG